MRRRLSAQAWVGAILLVAGSLALSQGRTEATIDPLSELASAAAAAGTTEPMEPVILPNEGFEIEVLVDGRPLEEYYARGRRYVEALDGAEYELRISNPLSVRVAVALSVDGLNTIDARRTTAWNASKWVIEPYGTINISGWQMSSARARRFYFTSERDSYGAKLGQTANLGTISAVFFRERTRVPVTIIPPPRRPIRPLEDERAEKDGTTESAKAPSQADSSSGSGAARSSNSAASPAPDDDYAATGIGRSVNHDVTWINLNLDQHPAAEVSLRYEYRDALVRLGVIPRAPYQRPDPLPRRERSTGFDDHRYSPEP